LGRSTLPLLHGADDLFFSLNGRGGCEMATRRMLAAANFTELARGDARIEVGANFRVGHLAHPAPHSVYEDSSFIKNSFTLEALVTGKGQRRTSPLIAFFKRSLMGSTPASLLRLGNDILSLVAVLGGDLPVSRNDLGGRPDLFSIARIMGCNLCRFRPRKATPRDGVDDLLPSWAGGVKVLLRIDLDLRCAAPSGLDLIAESA
jgi:hypothetical protein